MPVWFWRQGQQHHMIAYLRHSGETDVSQLLSLLHSGGTYHGPILVKDQGKGKTPRF